MREIVVKAAFSHANDGVTVVNYQPGEKPQPVSDRCAEVALENGWAEDAAAGGKKAPAKAGKKAEAEGQTEGQAEGGGA